VAVAGLHCAEALIDGEPVTLRHDGRIDSGAYYRVRQTCHAKMPERRAHQVR
jgi:hypothetical protein